MRKRVIFLTVIFLFLSVLYLNFAWNRYQYMASAEVIKLAQSLETLLHPEHIAKLNGRTEDIKKPEYVMIKASLERLTEKTEEIRFAYLMREKSGNLIFLVDSELPDSSDYSPPGQVYREASDIDFKPFKTGETVLTSPATDRWGTWISALVPIKDPSSGSVIAVLGLDYPVSAWYTNLWRQMIPEVIIVTSLFFLFLAFLHTRYQHITLKEVSRKLEVNETLYRSVFEQAPIGIAIVNDKRFIYKSELGYQNINPMFEHILGRKSNELTNVEWTEITHPEDLPEDLGKFEQFKTGAIDGYSMEKRFIKTDGSYVWVNMVVARLFLVDEEIKNHLCLIQDVTKRKEAEMALAESERSKTVLLSNLPGMAYRCRYDPEWTMEFVSDGCFELTGYPSKRLLFNRDMSFKELIAPDYREHLWKEWACVVEEKRPFKYEYEIITSKGERKWVLEMGEVIYNEQGEVDALEGIILDISDRKKMEDELRYNSEHDRWTGLYNRRYLENILINDARAGITKRRALVLVNLSPLNVLTITYGFQYTQNLIKEVTSALQIHCSTRRQLFNIYDNLFVFYLKTYKDRDELTIFCKEVEQTLESLLSTEGVGGGIGVLEIAQDKQHQVDYLFKDLLIASESAIDKFDKDIDFCFFNADMEKKNTREEIIKRELTHIAFNKNDHRLYLQFQPIFDLKSNKICGFEALARLKSKDLGLVPPIEFIPIAEKTRLIVPLGRLILIEAFDFLNTLKKTGYDKINVSVNVSVIQLFKKDFIQNLLEIMNKKEVVPANLGLEVTETAVASSFDEINEILRKLKEIGVRIAIDDFGTGYSSLAREREMNVDCLKIDKYFLDKLLSIKDEEAITGDIISMAHKMGHCVVAEGVEYERQLQYLKKHECDKVQGYLISKPLDLNEAIEILNSKTK
jgi:PAS domain S-box-containing protein